MLAIKIICFVFASLQTPTVVVKNNGDEVKLSSIILKQSPNRLSGELLYYTHKGSERSSALNSIRRINLKEVAERKRGVVTWEALIVMKNNNKLEVLIPLNKISGVDVDGRAIEISSNTIDKISF